MLTRVENRLLTQVRPRFHSFVKYSDLEEEFSSEIMNNRASFFGDLNEVLSDDGVVALHVSGDVRAVDSPSSNAHGLRADHLRYRQARIVTDLENVGFHETVEYQEVSAVSRQGGVFFGVDPWHGILTFVSPLHS
jgi:hypothetical protein